jgi:hypothetical protein
MLSLGGILDLLNNPSFKDGYRRDVRIMNWRRIYYGMSLHISGICPAYQYLRYDNGVYNYTWWYPNGEGCFEWEYQFLFDAQLFSRHPREPEVTRQWRLSQYKPFTKAPFKQVIQVTTGALFQDSGYSITVDNQEDNEYIWGENFHGKTLAQFFADKFQTICEDPNGLFVVVPKEPYYQTTTKRIEPDVWFVPSKFVRYHTDDEIIFEMNEIHWVINRVGYFRFAKDENKKFYNLDGADNGYYTHAFDHVPNYVAGGVWNTKGYYDSWLDAAKAIADEFVASKSAEQLVNKDASHPYTIETDTKCPDCEQSTGSIRWCVGCNHATSSCSCESPSVENQQLKVCGTCRGEGSISRNPADRIIAPADQMDKDLIKIVSPEVDINKFHAENNAYIYNEMLKALYLYRTDKAESGAAKAIDQEWKYQFFSAISNDLFGRLITRVLQDILALRNVTVNNGIVRPKPTDFTIVKPSQFQVKTSFDLQEEYKVAKESGLPSYQLSAILADFSDKRFGGNDAFLKKDYYVNALDKLATKNDADIQIMLLNNAVTPRDYQFHAELPMILDSIIRERTPDNFIRMSFEQVQSEVEARFNAIRPIIPAVRPEEILENRVTE